MEAEGLSAPLFSGAEKRNPFKPGPGLVSGVSTLLSRSPEGPGHLAVGRLEPGLRQAWLGGQAGGLSRSCHHSASRARILDGYLCRRQAGDE